MSQLRPVFGRSLLFLLLVFAAVQAVKADEGRQIPVTTSSKEALASFMEGRRLVENLQLTDAIPHFNKAVEKDPDFALAYLYLAQTAPTAKEFFASTDKASQLASKASEGEKLFINGFRAAGYGDPATQRKAYTRLVEMFPADQRALTLLGTHHFTQQDYPEAVKYLKKAVDIAPDFAPAYNQLGYGYRFLERYDEAEKTFKKYTELIPNDPNPYDSYAELLLKTGRFDEAIAQYRKALSIDEKFANSYVGIASALMYQGKHDQARAELEKASSLARNDGERRAAIFARAITFVDQGDMDQALKEFEKQFAIAEKINDVGAMAGDLTAQGNVLLELGRYDEAGERFERGMALIRGSNLAPEVKNNTDLVNHYNTGRVALGKKDLARARKDADMFLKGSETKKNSNQVRLAHELMGMIALEERQYDKAVQELQKSSLQNPYNLYRLATAYQALGKKEEARKSCTAAARFNVLPLLNYALIRQKAGQLLASI